MRITIEQFFGAVRANENETLPTAGGHATFLVKSADNAVTFIPTSSGKPRRVAADEISAYLRRFNKTGWTTTSRYSERRNPSYVLSIIKIILGQQLAVNPQAPNSDEVELDLELEATEGRIVMRMHRDRERSPELVKAAKAVFAKTHGRLFCQVCGFDFGKVYGAPDFIEAHHVVPLKGLKKSRVTKISDLAMVCANCHRMLHRGRSWPSISELKATLLTGPAGK